MPVDFFISPCSNVSGNCKKAGIVCKSLTNAVRFGISDKNANKREPAFIDTIDPTIWEVDINNPNGKDIIFKAVDYCVEIYRIGNYSLANASRDKIDFSVEDTDRLGKGLIKRCEGFLFYENNILFLELKLRRRGNWLSDAREKFEETILSFLQYYPPGTYRLLEPVVSNKTFTGTHQSEMVQKRIFKDKTGLDFHFKTSITIV